MKRTPAARGSKEAGSRQHYREKFGMLSILSAERVKFPQGISCELGYLKEHCESNSVQVLPFTTFGFVTVCEKRIRRSSVGRNVT